MSALCLVLGVTAGNAGAQTGERPAMRTHHVTVSGGLLWAGGYSVGDANAELRPNTLISAAPFTLFSTSSAVDPVAGAEGRIGVALSPSLAIEAGASYATPTISVAVSKDPEGAAQQVVGERIEQFVVDVSARWYLPMRLGPRLRPFALGGGGYLRQLHEDRTLVETGQLYYAGGGVSCWLRGEAGRARSIGLRSDVRANWRRKGIDFENRTRVYPSVTASVFVGF